VLVAGGDADRSPLSSAELYDPATGTWKGTGAMKAGRNYHTATLLPNKQVLVAGGDDNNGVAATVELYDPATGTWTTTGRMTTNRLQHTATLLLNGKVLVSGGSATDRIHNGLLSLSSSELYDPTTGTWAATSNALTTARAYHTATLLPSGKVLVIGGFLDGPGQLASVELFDPGIGAWTVMSNGLNSARWGHTATMLPSGKVMVTGGIDVSGNCSVTELYDAE
jgi:N-acetylneuraminic acid mutarotase